MRVRLNPLFRSGKKGLSLVELLVAMALLAGISLTIANFVIKGSATSSALGMRFTEASEIQMLLTDIRSDFQKGVMISNNSFNNRLEYVAYDTTGASVRKIFRIVTISGNKYLQLSTDGGTTWTSPYRASPYDRYLLKGTPKFLYAWSNNNCTEFVDTDGNGVRTYADAVGTYVACPYGTASPVLDAASYGNKVDLVDFQFSTGKGNPEAVRSLPSHYFIGTPGPIVRHSADPASPGVNAPVSLLSGSTTNNHFMFNNNGATPRGPMSVAWDYSRDRLILAGNTSSTANWAYITDRSFYMMKILAFASPANVQVDSLAVRANGNSMLVLDKSTNNAIYDYSLTGSNLTPASTLPLSSLTTPTVTTPLAIAYDAQTPSDFYIIGLNGTTYQIYQRNAATGAQVAATGNPWNLPAAFTASAPPTSFTVDPVTGDFLVLRNNITVAGSARSVDIYRIFRSGITPTSMTVPISTSMTGVDGQWRFAYDAILNRLFVSGNSSTTSNYLPVFYQIQAPVVISPRK